MEVKEVNMKEKTITNQILKYLKSLPECFAFKEHGGLYGTSGIPDIIVCLQGKIPGIWSQDRKRKAFKTARNHHCEDTKRKRHGFQGDKPWRSQRNLERSDAGIKTPQSAKNKTQSYTVQITKLKESRIF